MPAVSGSSGRLVVSAPKPTSDTPRTWPGRVFEQEQLSYAEALDQFVEARRAAEAAKSEATKSEATKSEAAKSEATDGAKAETALVLSESVQAQAQAQAQAQRAQRRALRNDSQRLQISRREERARRELVDQAWKRRRSEHQVELAAAEGSAKEPGSQEPKPGPGPRPRPRRNKSAERAALRAQWRAECAGRRRELAQRQQADRDWRQERQSLRERQLGVGLVPTWIAILVVVDNCTRQSLGLPLFALGAHVTGQLVVEALKALLPAQLQYLIADGGTHFANEAMKELAKAQGFVRVPLARHRPQSNGIAERFIETLKGWLADEEWAGAGQLGALLAEFLAYYNDRPHRGRELAGLSPNEYAARLTAA